MRHILCVLLILISLPLHAEEKPYSQFTLENGLDVIVLEDHRAPVVVNFIWFKAGAGDEVDGKTGLAHMLEHLMFKGTKNIPPQEFSKIIARNGGQDNAFTSYDYTAYYQKIAKDKLELAMGMEADRLTGLTFTEQDFIPERDVIAEERRWRVDSNPVNRFYEEMQDHHFETSPYGRPVIGYMNEIQKMTRTDNLAWYKKWYQPSNAVLILVGDITEAEAKALTAKTYAKIPSTKQIMRADWPIEKDWTEEKRFIKEDKEAKEPLFERFYRAPSAFAGVAQARVFDENSQKETLSLALLAQILGGSQTSILYTEMVKDKKIATNASSTYSRVSRGESTFDLTLVPASGVRLSELEKEVDALIARVISQGVDKADLERAKVQFLASSVYERDDPFVSAYMLGRWILSGGSVETYDDWQKEIDDISVKDLQAVAAKYLRKDRSTTGFLVQDKASEI